MVAKSKKNNIVRNMFISVVLGFVVGIGFLLLKNTLVASGNDIISGYFFY